MELRPYQQEAKDAIFDQWEKVDKTLLVLPTGCGKTIVFAKVTEECVRRGCRVLILAHRGDVYSRQQIRSRRQQNWDVRLRRQMKHVWEAGSVLQSDLFRR